MTPKIMGCPGRVRSGQQVQSSQLPSLGWRAPCSAGLKGRKQQLLGESVGGATCLQGDITGVGNDCGSPAGVGGGGDGSETRTSSYTQTCLSV